MLLIAAVLLAMPDRPVDRWATEGSAIVTELRIAQKLDMGTVALSSEQFRVLIGELAKTKLSDAAERSRRSDADVDADSPVLVGTLTMSLWIAEIVRHREEKP